MNTLIFLRYICAALTIATNALLAQFGQTVERYSKLPASADGIGKGYMGCEIAAVMGWQCAAWLEREERTDLLLAALVLQPGNVVADIVTGTEYLSLRMAPIVMPGGKIWAVDVQPKMIALLQAGVKRSGYQKFILYLSGVK